MKSNAYMLRANLASRNPYHPAPLFSAQTQRDLPRLAQRYGIDEQTMREMRVVSTVLPFRTNPYVTEELIDWSRVPDDPIFQLVFPQKDMLEPEDFDRIARLYDQGAEPGQIRPAALEIQKRLNPHPSLQQELNVPIHRGKRLHGLQHKYRETVLFFPSEGQTCHAYCSFCFRWAQFIGVKELRFAGRDIEVLCDYLKDHTEVTNVLITGGDPLIMKTRHLAAYLEALLQPGLEHIHTVRIGTKALSYWPQRFVSDPDAAELLALFERFVARGKQLAIMTHYNHWLELETPIAREAVRKLRETGAILRSQSPVLRHINDDADVWARLWRTQAGLGIVPYYMFVERDTGARRYFELPLVRAAEIFRGAIQQVSGVARTVRGPVMSAAPGKVEIDGVARIEGKDVMVLRFLQGRDPDWVHRPFFADYDPAATWLHQLRPAFGDKFFYEDQFTTLYASAHE